MRTLTCLLTGLAVPALVATARAQTADELFGLTRLHEIHLSVSAENWKAMQPPAGGGPGAGGRRGMAGRMGMDYPEVRASLTLDEAEYAIGLRFKGNSTYMMSARGLKRPLKIDLNQFAPGQSAFGQTKLNLNNNASDPTQVREALAYELFRQLGVPASRTAFAQVYLDVPGQYDRRYLGLYTLVEQVDAAFLTERFGTGEGLLLKPDQIRGFPAFGDDWKAYERAYVPKNKPTDAEKARFIAFAQWVNQADADTFAREIGDHLDLENAARFLAGNAALTNLDSILSMGQNFYLWHNPRTDRFLFIPWDLNMAFGGFPLAGGDPVRLSVRHPHAGDHPLLDKLLATPAFRTAYEDALRQAASALKALAPRYDSVQVAVRAAVRQEPTERSGGFGGPPGGPGGGPFGRRTPELKPFLEARSAAILAQLDGKDEGVIPRGAPFGPGGLPGGGPGGPPGGPGGFDPAAFLGPMFLNLTGAGEKPTLAAFAAAWKKKAAQWDANHDKKLTRDELGAGLNGGAPFGPGGILGRQLLKAMKAKEAVPTAAFSAALVRWATGWDANHDKKLDAAEVGSGLTKTLPPPDFGPGGFPGGPPPFPGGGDF